MGARSKADYAARRAGLDVFGGGGGANGPVTTGPFLDRFESVAPGSLGERSGIRAGDALDLRLVPPAARYWERNEQLAGVLIRLPLVRNGAVTWLTVKPEPYTQIPFWASS